MNSHDITFGDEDLPKLTQDSTTSLQAQVMASKFGQIKEFQPDSDFIKSYLERVQLYFDANNVAQTKHVPILLSSLGAQTYSLLSDLAAPDLPSTKSFDDISVLLRAHYEPKRAIIAERFHFHKREQRGDETIAEFDAALRRLATHCKFKDHLDDALRDRFVCGLRSDIIQRRLLAEPDLNHGRAMELAQAMESAELNTKSFKKPVLPIKNLSTYTNSKEGAAIRGVDPPNSRERQACFRCGRTNHSETNCKFKNAECHRCGKIGHIAPICRTKLDRTVKQIRATSVSDSDREEEYHLF